MWGLYNNKGDIVPPLLYSNEKGQDTVIREIIEAFRSYNIVLLQGAVGTGKSVIGLHVANELGGGIIVVPTKILQAQYARDYCDSGSFRIRRKDGSWLRICIIKGRANFQCLYDKNVNCSHKNLPCNIPLWTETDEEGVKRRVSRIEVAKECPYYSPVIRSNLSNLYMSELECELEPIEYSAVTGKFSILRRGDVVCRYFQQYREYESADVIIMNSAIWLVETLILGRKPAKPIEIIDEGDAFLDSLTLKKTINKPLLGRIEKRLDNNLEADFNKIKADFINLTRMPYQGEIRVKEKQFLKAFVSFLDKMNDELSNNYTDLMHFIDKCYVAVRAERGGAIDYFVPEPRVVVRRIFERSADRILLMSATFQSQRVLEEIFGLDNFCYIQGEPQFPGKVILRKIGNEWRVTHKSWQAKAFRQRYWHNLMDILKSASKPVVVPVHAFKYLPDKIRERIMNKSSLETRDKRVIFSTTMKRGVDLRDDKCRAIVMLKYPYPDMSDPLLRAMKLRLGEDAFWHYYHDIARREFIQTIGRGVRHKDDWVELWSPDKTVLRYLHELWRGQIIEDGELKIIGND